MVFKPSIIFSFYWSFLFSFCFSLSLSHTHTHTLSLSLSYVHLCSCSRLATSKVVLWHWQASVHTGCMPQNTWWGGCWTIMDCSFDVFSVLFVCFSFKIVSYFDFHLFLYTLLCHNFRFVPRAIMSLLRKFWFAKPSCQPANLLRWEHSCVLMSAHTSYA